MEDPDPRAEAVLDTCDHLRRDSDLRNQKDRSPSLSEDFGKQPQVHFGLAAAGHTQQQPVLLALATIRRCEGTHSGVLLRRQLPPARRDSGR